MEVFYEYWNCHQNKSKALWMAQALEALKGVLDNTDTLDAFTRSPLYRHMIFKTMENEFGEQLRCKLKCEFQKDERLDFLRNDPRLKEILT